MTEGPLGFDEDDAPAEAPVEPPAAFEPPPIVPEPPSTSRYTWFVGIVAVVLLALIGVNTLRNGPGSHGPPIGSRVPSFAAPLAVNSLGGHDYVNVAQKSHSGDAGHVAACTVHRPDVVTICDEYRRHPVAIVFFATRGGQCTHELDVLQRVLPRHPGVGVVAVAVKGRSGSVRKVMTEHGWTFPVAYDRDGLLSNTYAVAVCPEIVWVRKGGRTAAISFGRVGPAKLEAQLAALERGAPIPKG